MNTNNLIDIDQLLSFTNEPLKVTFASLLGIPFFIESLTKEEALKEVNKYFHNTFPALVYKEDNAYFCIYP